jgi:hypothetical protein
MSPAKYKADYLNKIDREFEVTQDNYGIIKINEFSSFSEMQDLPYLWEYSHDHLPDRFLAQLGKTRIKLAPKNPETGTYVRGRAKFQR